MSRRADTHYGLPRAIGVSLADKPRYFGTVDPGTRDERREKNKRARKARKANRRKK